MAERPGVYICSGCGIGQSLDIGKLVKVATAELKVPRCEAHSFLCGPEGVDLIRRDIASETVDGVVIAACSPRVKTDAFSFDPLMVLDRVNLREHVIWCHKPNDEDTQMLAEDYLRMGVTKVRKSEPLEPQQDEISKRLLVVGGGVAGMTAAIEAATAGYDVVLVEKSPRLGGFVAALAQRFPTAPPYTDLQAGGVAAQIQQVSYHPKIQVLTSATIRETSGQPGMFDVTIAAESGELKTRVGAIVLATGWRPYDATKLGQLGYGASPDVITNVEFERLAAAGPIVRPSDGRPVMSVLFVQCAGSRDERHLPYCSSTCCMATLKHATMIHAQNPDAAVFVVYKDIRTPGQYERFYRAAQDHPLTFLTKGEIVGVEADGGGRMAATVKDTLVGEQVRIEADLVVLATGMVPNAADGAAIRLVKDSRATLARAEATEPQKSDARKKIADLAHHEGTEILCLTYRQGPDLPAHKYGFPDSHFVCFPYETRRTGIYAAGAVRAPMDGAHAQEDAMGAAMKAIQSVELASRGAAVHPRAGDLSFPSFFLQRCTQCKRCTEECPFGTLDEDPKGTPQLNVYRCRRCGVCMGACPERIISFKNYSVDMIASMIKAIEVPDEDEEKPRVLVLMCENDAYPALDVAGLNRVHYDPSVRVVPLRCLGSLNIVWIADALSGGIDGVMLVGCKYGDDYQCHFVQGSELANRRLENVKETLQRLQLESERIQLTQLAINEYGKLPALIDEFMDRIRDLGPNPYKGF
ncbi:MAG: hydrogenase iron-sulfur subunit [Acidobacteriota bacterium]